MHFVRCPLMVRQFCNANLGVSFQGRLLAPYDSSGDLLSACSTPNKVRRRQCATAGPGQKCYPSQAWTARIQNPHFFCRTPKPGEHACEKML